MKTKILLQQPYPFPSQSWKTIAIISLCISACMVLLQPFGLSQLQLKHKSWFLVGYGLITFIVLAVNIRFIVKLFSEYNWNILKQILWSLWIVILLGLANYLYSLLFTASFQLNIVSILNFQFFTISIAIVPITILVLIRQNSLLKSNQSGAAIINKGLTSLHEEAKPLSQLRFTSENGKHTIEINAEDLAYIESIGNYIYIYQLRGGKIAPITLRSTISKAEIVINGTPSLIKCHRAFIVNIHYIEQVDGNAQGYRLTIRGAEHTVFVSRQYTKKLKEAMN